MACSAPARFRVMALSRVPRVDADTGKKRLDDSGAAVGTVARKLHRTENRHASTGSCGFSSRRMSFLTRIQLDLPPCRVCLHSFCVHLGAVTIGKQGDAVRLGYIDKGHTRL